MQASYLSAQRMFMICQPCSNLLDTFDIHLYTRHLNLTSLRAYSQTHLEQAPSLPVSRASAARGGRATLKFGTCGRFTICMNVVSNIGISIRCIQHVFVKIINIACIECISTGRREGGAGHRLQGRPQGLRDRIGILGASKGVQCGGDRAESGRGPWRRLRRPLRREAERSLPKKFPTMY